ncbi:hypothetical protein D1013_15080 [Euzebyella marina]|uniref:Uncharacterized protein n=1 Tax=Euzebyella marina TaxID=1761453 RepID=A0A3G2L8K7_9FLAO|nr:hypothetical protein [Euzebyella marina]AYN68605.1 hypothetical protein D1013_15080 [Euzebyella marina]
MKNHNLISILFVAISLAVAWAIRGQFGHEQGAAWAGAIGGSALVIASGRRDWYQKMLVIALASAVGWGAGGMISYGQVVGYGRSDDFFNAYYGLVMLFVIGGLFGLLGGGLVGLVLDSTKEKRVKWGSLMAEMTAGGILTYYFLVEQIGFKMTPPRSEAWAVILGAGLAMIWHMAREGRNSPLRVAFFATLGGGLGFSFGNFLHVVGNVMEIPFNMWNVMEYCIGFMGGMGMAYGVFTSKWPEQEAGHDKLWVNKSALVFIVVFIPLIVFRESLAFGHMLKRLGDIANAEKVASISTSVAAILLLIMSLWLFYKLKFQGYNKVKAGWFMFSLLLVYTLMSYLVTGILAGNSPINQHLYLANIIFLFFLYQKKLKLIDSGSLEKLPQKWGVVILTTLLFLALCAFIAINTHGELPGSNNRF